jgi:hypothetical protein
METTENLADEYAGQPDAINIENTYNNDIHLLNKNKIEEQLENNYKHTISLQELSKDDTTDLKSIYRQLKRLKYCVQNIDYKLSILYKNYICSIRRDDSISFFSIKSYPRDENKKLLLSIDLEFFYEKFETIPEEIQLVRQSIYHVLQKNQSSHGKVLEKIIENKKDITEIPKLTEIKKTKYLSMISRLENMLNTMIIAEKKILEELFELNNNENNNLHNDIQKIHRKASLEKELDKINIIKGNIGKNITIVRQKMENSILNIDKIMFDNTVMFDSMVNNFARLKNFC